MLCLLVCHSVRCKTIREQSENCGSHGGISEDSSLLGRLAVPTGKELPTCSRVIVISSSGSVSVTGTDWITWLWIWRHNHTPKRRGEKINSRKGVKSQKTWICNPKLLKLFLRNFVLGSFIKFLWCFSLSCPVEIGFLTQMHVLLKAQERDWLDIALSRLSEKI